MMEERGGRKESVYPFTMFVFLKKNPIHVLFLNLSFYQRENHPY